MPLLLLSIPPKMDPIRIYFRYMLMELSVQQVFWSWKRNWNTFCGYIT